jgi:hypothetical protein
VLLSGGEDSRVVLACLPDRLERHAFTITDTLNREAKLASRIARAHGAAWHHQGRGPDHYVRQFYDAMRLVGFENEANQVHCFQLAERFALRDYAWIAGGLFADAFLKGNFVPRAGDGSRLVARWRLAPEPAGYAAPPGVRGLVFRSALVDEMVARRDAHLARVRAFRPSSAWEWSRLWPITQDQDGVSFQGNRRLFRICEPFTDSAIVKVAAASPAAWKLNRVLFRAAFAPLLRRSRFVPHPEGHFPALGRSGLGLWLILRGVRAAGRLPRRTAVNEGPWPEFEAVASTGAMRAVIEAQRDRFETIRSILAPEVDAPAKLFSSPYLAPVQRFLVVQALELAAGDHYAGLFA